MKTKIKAAIMTLGIMLIIFALLSLIMIFPTQASLLLMTASVSILTIMIYKLLKRKYDDEENLS